MVKKAFGKDDPERLVFNTFVKLCQDNYNLTSPKGDTTADFEEVMAKIQAWHEEMAKTWKREHGTDLPQETKDLALFFGNALLNKLQRDERRAKGMDIYCGVGF